MVRIETYSAGLVWPTLPIDSVELRRLGTPDDSMSYAPLLYSFHTLKFIVIQFSKPDTFFKVCEGCESNTPTYFRVQQGVQLNRN